MLQDWSYSSGPGQDSTTGSWACTNPAGVAVGELLLVICVCDSTSGAPNMSTTTPGWSKIGEIGDTARDVQIAAFWKIASGSDDTVTVDLSIARRFYYFSTRFSNIDGTTPINASAFSQATGDPINITGVTTTVANCLVVGAIGTDGSATFTWNTAGWTKIAEDSSGSIQLGCSFATKEQASAGATGTSNVSLAGTEPSACFQIAIAPA